MRAPPPTPRDPAIRALLVDPSLFTAPYDAALTGGLLDAGVEPTWAVRPVRPGDEQEIGEAYVDPFFYRRAERLERLPRALRMALKGVEHLGGLARLVRTAYQQQPDVVHFQWLIVPIIDSLAIWGIGRRFPVVLTVHDTLSFNGDQLWPLQGFALELPLHLADGVIVHTRSGREALIQRGVPAHKVTVIPHGPLQLAAARRRASCAPTRTDDRWTFVLFGEIKRYKGLDVLVEAIGRLPSEVRVRGRFIVAGRAMIDLAPVEQRIAELGLGECIELQPRRLTEDEMADLFALADCFLFPYRNIDASGVYFLTKSYGKWIIASRIGIFAEELEEGKQGELVPPEDPRALADALVRAIELRAEPPTPASTADSWKSIGQVTRKLYQRVMGRH